MESSILMRYSYLTVYSTSKKFPIKEAPLFLFKLVFLQLILA